MKNPNTPKTKKEVEAMRKKIKKLLWDNSYGDWKNGNLPEKVYKKYDEYPDFLTDKIMALLNPVEKETPPKKRVLCHFCKKPILIGDLGGVFKLKDCKEAWFHKWLPCISKLHELQKAPSPNEAPKDEEYKGHATLKNPCYCECHTEGDEDECPKCKFAKAPKGEACDCDCHKVVESMNKKKQGWESNCGFCGHRSKPQPPVPDKEWVEAKALFFEELDYRVGVSDDFIRTLDTVLEIAFKPLLSKDQEADRRIEEVIGEIEKFIKARDFQIFFSYQDKKDWEALKKKLSSK